MSIVLSSKPKGGRNNILSRKHFGGGALRVSTKTVTTASQSSDEENNDIVPNKNKLLNGNAGEQKETGHPIRYKKRKTIKLRTDHNLSLSNSKWKALKITKEDIGYMLNWSPTRHRHQTTTCTNNANPERLSSNASSGVDFVDSYSGNAYVSNKSIHHGRSHHAAHGMSFHSIKNQEEVEPGERPEVRADTVSPEEISSSSKVVDTNSEFLPLVHRDNIVLVNGTPYMKLGIIGKGGSCKVYRALSKECKIVAIKKVKLAGMTKKLVEGYANEISLLKRLRGNPAIIHMYDSDVDLGRKAIFLVMESGEVDLNQVLHQQYRMGDDNPVDGRCTLNMNFIRLTWQQMLSAVHSIHEERIIHGDLKPANFLFVRGALKLIDFGIAKAIQGDDTTNIYRETQTGTLNYMSPESILDTGTDNTGARMKCGRASDIWSLGCILYQMCYGRTPFAELHMIKKVQAIVNPNHQILFLNTIDTAAMDAMKLCLKRKPEERLPIVGKNGLLNDHWFLHSKERHKTGN